MTVDELVVTIEPNWTIRPTHRFDSENSLAEVDRDRAEIASASSLGCI